MPYALFCNDAKLSKAYPTEADVWKLARQSGLVVDAASKDGKPAPQPVLDNDYEIRPCRPDPQEDPAKNQADAEREAERRIAIEFFGVGALRSALVSSVNRGPIGRRTTQHCPRSQGPSSADGVGRPTASPPPATPARRRAPRRLSCDAAP